MLRLVWLIPAVILLSVCAPVAATTVEHTLFTQGGITTYNYVLTSDENSDLVTSFHLYAPTQAELVTGWTTAPGWEFSIDPDPESGGVDIYWEVVDPISNGIGFGERLDISISTSSDVPTVNDFVVPGFLGNWGYETYNWAGWGVLVMPWSVPVPSGVEPTPEPLGLIALGVGCALLAPWRRR